MRLDDLVAIVRGPRRPTARQARNRRICFGGLAALALLAFVVGATAGAGARSERERPPAATAAAAPRDRWEAGIAALAGRVHELTLASARALARTALAREEEAIERVRARTPVVHRGGGRRRLIALTFDDGPSAHTEALLDVLERHRVPATFFVLGERVDAHPRAMERLLRSGMAIGNHTRSHPLLPRLGRRAQQAEIDAGAGAIVAAGAGLPRLFRPPYGAQDATTAALLARRGGLSVLWSVDSEDYTRPGAARIADRVVAAAHPGAIVLLHDGGGDRTQTVEAVRRIIPRLRRAGYRFVTVPQLLLADPPRTQRRARPRDADARPRGERRARRPAGEARSRPGRRATRPADDARPRGERRGRARDDRH